MRNAGVRREAVVAAPCVTIGARESVTAPTLDSSSTTQKSSREFVYAHSKYVARLESVNNAESIQRCATGMMELISTAQKRVLSTIYNRGRPLTEETLADALRRVAKIIPAARNEAELIRVLPKTLEMKNETSAREQVLAVMLRLEECIETYFARIANC